MIIATPSGGIKGGAWGHGPLSRRPCPHLLPPPPQKKWPKSNIFGKFMDFCPPQNRILSPRCHPHGKKNLVPPLTTPSGGLIKS